MAVEVFMPKMSDNMAMGIIVNWLSKEGDRVEKGQPILEIETDKATAEIEAPESGFLKGIRAGVVAGSSVPVGDTIAFIAATRDEDVPALPQLGGLLETSGAQFQEQVTAHQGSVFEEGEGDGGPVRAAPAVRRIARELGVDLSQVKGKGPGGRVTEADVRNYLEAQEKTKQVQPAAPQSRQTEQMNFSPLARRIAQDLGVDLSKVKSGSGRDRITKEDIRAFVESEGPSQMERLDTSEEEWLDLSKAQLITGQLMVESVQIAPQFALSTRADMTRALELRETALARIEAQTGARLSITGILVKIVADALKHFPRANASFIEGRIKLHSHINIGVAMGTDEGLFVPVIRDAHLKTLAEITAELKDLQEKADRKRFGTNDLMGGTFTISNLGMYGVDHFYAILNPPETGILAVGRIIKIPVGMPDDTITLRPMMNLTISIDHRSLDGMQGAKFLALVRENLEQPYLIL